MRRPLSASRAYVYGCMSNTEPPDDDDLDEDEGGMDALERDGFDLGDDGPDEYAADAAADRYERELDARASQ